MQQQNLIILFQVLLIDGESQWVEQIAQTEEGKFTLIFRDRRGFPCQWDEGFYELSELLKLHGLYFPMLQPFNAIS